MNNYICCMITVTLYNKTIINSPIKALRVDSVWVSVDEHLVHVSSISLCLVHVSGLQTLCD